jgi:hypothetical protein
LAVHIHQVHFLIYAQNGVRLERPEWLDTVNVPVEGNIDLMMDFTDPIIRGISLFHCHLLSHEDKGMMAKILKIRTRELGISSVRNVVLQQEFQNVSSHVDRSLLDASVTSLWKQTGRGWQIECRNQEHWIRPPMDEFRQMARRPA